MLAAIIITLREMLEVCLIVGIISAALNNIPSKRKIVLTGIFSGIILSVIFALTIQQITNLFNGNGQEVLDIIILTTSIICIALTLILINKQGNSLRQKLISASQETNILPVILIITLAIAREGAEITLFLHGIYTVNMQLHDLVNGVIIGATLGILLGLMLYLGLLKISSRYFFKAINIMLALLASGMASQLANYLHSTDLISVLSETAWDSSWLVQEEGLMGKLLYNLVGYSSHPSKLQVIFFSSTLAAMSLLLSKQNK